MARAFGLLFAPAGPLKSGEQVASDVPISFAEEYYEAVNVASPGAGTQGIALSVVPANEWWWVTSVQGANATRIATFILADVVSGGVLHRLGGGAAVAAALPVGVVGWIPLAPGANLQVWFGGCVLGDSLYAWATGFKQVLR